MNNGTHSQTEELVIEGRVMIREAARQVGRHPLTLRRLEAAGKIPLARRDFQGRRIYTDQDIAEIDRIINSLTEPSQKAS